MTKGGKISKDEEREEGGRGSAVTAAYLLSSFLSEQSADENSGGKNFINS
jgi:hypothetical protein